MRILLDECVDRRLAAEIVGHDVQTVPQMGWAGRRNGDLLRLAADQFDVFVTVDRQLSVQHEIARYDLIVAVLISRSNRVSDLQPLVPSLLAHLASATPGLAIEVT